MAIGTPVNIGTLQNKAVATLDLITVSPVATGESIVVAIGTNANLLTFQLSISDTVGNTYTFVVRESPNADSALGVQFIYECQNAIALPSGSTISVTSSAGSVLMTIAAITVSGIGVQIPLTSTSFGNNASPTDTITGLTSGKNYLALGYVYTEGPSGDTFTQDGAWAAPPNRIGTTGGAATTNNTSAGGYDISDVVTSFTYAPTITSRPWAAIIVVYEESSGSSSSMFFMF